MVVTLEVSRLSGRLNAVAACRESKGGHTVWGEVWAGRRETVGDGGLSSVQGRDRLQIRSRARGEAHVEHEAHVCDAGGVEAQRLVEIKRVLPSAARRAYDARRHAGREAGGRGAATAHAACRRGPDWASRGGARGAHVEHAAHGCDAGGVEAQRLVERRRLLQRVKRRAFGEGRGAEYREAGGGGRPRCTRGTHGRARMQIGGKHGE